jgi:hypothetical protein
MMKQGIERSPEMRPTKILMLLSSAIMLTIAPNQQRGGAGSAHDGSRKDAARMYLGFDRNDYPGDVVLDALHHTFAFCGYWLNAPPGERATNWTGKREILRAHGFGFLVLFNGRLDKELKPPHGPKLIGANDAQAAVKAAQADGFARGTVIFVDQEEGGSMLPEQQEYLRAWIDGVNAAGYRAGVYCSGMSDKYGAGGVITANDIREHAGGRRISFFVYNDSCPPSPGCIFSARNITPAQSGIPFAAVWQIAQSPRRKSLTRKCAATYAAGGNCYPPGLAAQGIFVDVDISASADPSNGR